MTESTEEPNNMAAHEEQMMMEELQSRLELLRREFALGQTRLQELELQQEKLRETLLRISGAIQVLEELLAEHKPAQETNKPSEAPAMAMIHE